MKEEPAAVEGRRSLQDVIIMASLPSVRGTPLTSGIRFRINNAIVYAVADAVTDAVANPIADAVANAIADAVANAVADAAADDMM